LIILQLTSDDDDDDAEDLVTRCSSICPLLLMSCCLRHEDVEDTNDGLFVAAAAGVVDGRRAGQDELVGDTSKALTNAAPYKVSKIQ
jgi:hypothetical protein